MLFFSPGLGGDFMVRDVFHEYYTVRLMYRLARARAFPLWDPYVGLGTPLSGAVFTGTLYPVNIFLFVFLPVSTGAAIKIYVLLHFALAGAGMVSMLKRIGAAGPGAWSGAVAYAFSGYAVSQHYALNLLPALALLPWAAGLMAAAGKEARFRPALAAGLLTGLMFVGGDPQGAGLAILICVAMMIICAGEGTRVPIKKLPGIAVIYIVTAALAAAAEWAPMVTVLGESARGSGFDFDTAACWSLAPLRAAELVFSRPFGDPWPADRWWGSFLGERCFPWPMTLSLYMGVMSGLGWLGAWRNGGWRGRRVIFFTALAGLSFALALGRYAPLYGIIYRVFPLVRSFRYPEKYLLISCFALAALAGLGICRLAEPPPDRDRSLSRKQLLTGPLLALLAAAAAGAVFLLTSGPIAHALAPLLGPGTPAEISPGDAARDLAFAIIRGLLVLAASLLAINAARRVPGRALAYAPAALLFLDLGQANSMLAPTARGLYQSESKFARAIPAGEMLGPNGFRLFRAPNILAPAGLTYEQTRRWERDTLRSNLGMIEGFEELSGQNLAASGRHRFMMAEVISFDALPVFSVKYAVIPDEWAGEVSGRAETMERYLGATLVAVEQPFPRAYWVGASRWVSGEDEVAGAWPGHDFRRSVLLEPLPDGTAVMDAGLVHNPELLAQEITIREPNRVIVKVKAPAPGWLILNDAWYPGWTAAVDGAPAAVYRANGLVRAVRVDAGEHEVVFAYRPPGLIWGLVLSGAAWIGGIAFLLVRKN